MTTLPMVRSSSGSLGRTVPNENQGADVPSLKGKLVTVDCRDGEV